MIIDKNLTFADKLAVNATAGTALRGDVVFLGTGVKNPARGGDIYLVIDVTTAFTGSGASVQFTLASDAQAAIAVDGTATEHALTEAIPVTALVAGFRRVIKLPVGVDYEPYLGLLVTISGATVTAGAISAYFAADAQNWDAHTEAVS